MLPVFRHGLAATTDSPEPLAIWPGNVIANLELMPLRMNESKNDKVGARQLDLARKLNAAGLLSTDGKQKIENHPQR